VHATSTAIIVDRKGISAPFPNLLSEDETARQLVNTERKAMNQIEKLKAKLAMASPHEAQTIKALIATLEAAPDDSSQSEQLASGGDSDPRLRFLNHEQANRRNFGHVSSWGRPNALPTQKSQWTRSKIRARGDDNARQSR